MFKFKTGALLESLHLAVKIDPRQEAPGLEQLGQLNLNYQWSDTGFPVDGFESC